MFSTFKPAWLPAFAVAGLQITAWPAQAQPAAQVPSSTPASRADPADPKAPVPAALYASPLRTYQRFAEPAVAPWRDTNEAVRQRGGWREYAREGRDAPAGEAAPPAPGAVPGTASGTVPAASRPAGPSQPGTGGHSGHRMK